jgi:KDO2-lipid IV(A) lauroyltransferase
LDLEKVKKLVNVTNPELINNKLKLGKGLVLISAHFGNWELIAYSVSMICGEPFNIIVKEQSNKVIDKKINRIRESGGNKMIYMETSLKSILKLLASNKIVAMLGDQSAPKESPVKTDFFMKNVPTFEGAARFAIRTGAPVIFGVPVRNKDHTYSITLIELDTLKYKEYNESNIAKLTQEHVDLLKEHITAHPDHWLWFHRRFKNVE